MPLISPRIERGPGTLGVRPSLWGAVFETVLGVAFAPLAVIVLISGSEERPAMITALLVFTAVMMAFCAGLGVWLLTTRKYLVEVNADGIRLATGPSWGRLTPWSRVALIDVEQAGNTSLVMVYRWRDGVGEGRPKRAGSLPRLLLPIRTEALAEEMTMLAGRYLGEREDAAPWDARDDAAPRDARDDAAPRDARDER